MSEWQVSTMRRSQRELPSLLHEICLPYSVSIMKRTDDFRMLHDKHPSSLGESYKTTWEEIYADPPVVTLLDEIWEKGIMNGQATMLDDWTFFLRNGSRLEERVFNLSLILIFGATGETVGFYEPLMEITSDHLSKRRLSSLSKIGEVNTIKGRLGAFLDKIMDALEDNGQDEWFS